MLEDVYKLRYPNIYHLRCWPDKKRKEKMFSNRCTRKCVTKIDVKNIQNSC